LKQITRYRIWVTELIEMYLCAIPEIHVLAKASKIYQQDAIY